ncbi:MAG TPA: thioredoxin domain-containing protein [Anaerolineales bacterium]|nr:thioredoxin domain-containing protein [Anaerolineales bacterium]
MEKKTLSKRETIREQRRKKEQRNKILIIGAATIAALALGAIIFVPNLINANTPVGEIVQITPVAHPQEDGRAMGPVDAKVVVEVFEDFQCVACEGYTQSIEPLVLQNYVETGKIRYEFRHYPFLDDRSSVKESDQAANASMCAADQGRFWDFHDILFANFGEGAGAYTDNRLEAYAEAIGLDMNAFNTCYQNEQFDSVIKQDMADATSLGVTGTPTVFVNGKLTGREGLVATYDEISQMIEQELAASGS